MKNAKKVAINNLALIRYKWVILVVIMCLAFCNIVDALEEATPNEKDVNVTDEEDTSSNDYYFDEPVQEMFIEDVEEQININYCGSPTCRFLFPVFVEEQESRTQQHIKRLLLMAQKTNRVLVLPNVEDARLGACKSFSFDFYYSMDETENFPDTTVITQSQFLLWNQDMREVNAKIPTAKVVLVNSCYKIKEEKMVSKRLNLETYKDHNCMQPFDYLDYQDENENIKALNILTRKTSKDRVAIARFVIDGLQSVQSDVLLMHYSFPRLNIPQVVEQAENAAPSRSYMARWQMEPAKAGNLVDCALI
ncbi:5748_t:CDS:2 [Paraglomus brasilianum]|uniref:5748_t:CDS:1 n=1 Tax=Paraglomus brasilianum TaxID=144538 RepID=A0A9N9GK88_9GLOM|nr:5748_t:CDS:2 [Paraglomus brasilianum]